MSSVKIRVKELVDNTIEQLEKMGLDKRTLWASCLTNFRTIERYYRKRVLVYYDQDIT